MSVFKAYDVRGRYPSEIDEPFATSFGHALADFSGGRRFAVGHDVRLSAPSIAAAVRHGLSAQGVDVFDIGLCTTPMLYYAVGHLALDGGVMVTASHNPPEWIGFKVCREQAFPIGERTGLREIEERMGKRAPPRAEGTHRPCSILQEYRRHIRSSVTLTRPMKVAVDTANGCVGAFFHKIFDDFPIEWVRLCSEPDGRFPNHEPNPLKDENIRDLREAVRRERCDLGIAFDGDGDRCLFVDEHGERVPSDLMTVLLARQALAMNPGAAVVYDLRSSRVVREEIDRAGGKPIRERVGHAFIKETMRKHNAVFGGELSGHYYFRDHFFADSGMMACARVLHILGHDTKAISEQLKPFRRYQATGEINFRIENKTEILAKLQNTFSDGRLDVLDGITVEYDEWWFNVRTSNTEPLLRLNLEARTKDQLEWAKKRLLAILGNPL